MAIVRQTDLHKLLFANIWPDIASTFRGTVYKMRFLKAADIPFAPKLFVLGFFAVFFVSVIVPLVKYIVPLIKGFFRREPVAWTMATLGTVSTMVILIDRLPANLRKSGVAVSDGALSLMRELGLSDPTEILYVGDTSVDMDTGKSAGFYTVGVKWGFRTEEELREHKADAVVSHPLEIIKYL
jgi:hypothetical protein